MSTKKLAPMVINDEGFMFDPTTGDSFVVNHSAIAILQGLQDGRSDAEIAQMLVDRYDVSLESAIRDLTEFMSRLNSQQLL